MAHRNLLKMMYNLHKSATGVKASSKKQATTKKVTEQTKQEAQYQTQLPVSVPKQVRQYWDALAEQKRKEADSSEAEITSSE